MRQTGRIGLSGSSRAAAANDIAAAQARKPSLLRLPT
jgi:hypothetical protein